MHVYINPNASQPIKEHANKLSYQVCHKDIDYFYLN
ncbi:hypothetical protein GYH30_049661 [Glycine max]|uniref:Uncharacterized protein n=1 Tax=Glycine max TaxID=3847 RepID=A0A0R0EZ53_SOYBN|nr:hypothetical protein GYH30_049661 [Glycine max]